MSTRCHVHSIWEVSMLGRSSFAAIVLAAGLGTMTAAAQVIDPGKYPDWSAQWNRVPDGGPPRYDPSKPLRKQEAPLKPEYQALHEASLKDLDAGGFGRSACRVRCPVFHSWNSCSRRA